MNNMTIIYLLKANMVADGLSQKAVSIGSPDSLQMREHPLDQDVQSLYSSSMRFNI